MTIFRTFSAVVLLVVTSLTATAFGQANNGRLTGTVLDPSGGVLPGALVTLRNLGTNASTEITTDAEGRFAFPEQPIGRYQLTVALEGFQTAVLSDVTLLTGQLLDLKVPLQVGDISSSVDVTGGVPLVQSGTSSVQTSMTERQVQELPLNGRNPLQLVALTAGATITDAGTVAGQQDNRGISVNGLRTTQNNFRLDGSNYTNRFFGSAPILPNPDTLQEFTVQSANYSARTAGAGALVELSTRSGTNDFHGSGFEFLRDTVAQRQQLLHQRAAADRRAARRRRDRAAQAAVQAESVRRHARRADRQEPGVLLRLVSGHAAAIVAELGDDPVTDRGPAQRRLLLDRDADHRSPHRNAVRHQRRRQRDSRRPARSDRPPRARHLSAAAGLGQQPARHPGPRRRRRPVHGEGRSGQRPELPERAVQRRRQRLPAAVHRSDRVLRREQLPEPQPLGAGHLHAELEPAGHGVRRLLEVPPDPGAAGARAADAAVVRGQRAADHRHLVFPRRPLHRQPGVPAVLGRRARADAELLRLSRHRGVDARGARAAVRQRRPVRSALHARRLLHARHVDLQRPAHRRAAGRRRPRPAQPVPAGLGPHQRSPRVEVSLLDSGRLEGPSAPDPQRSACAGSPSCRRSTS